MIKEGNNMNTAEELGIASKRGRGNCGHSCDDCHTAVDCSEWENTFNEQKVVGGKNEGK